MNANRQLASTLPNEIRCGIMMQSKGLLFKTEERLKTAGPDPLAPRWMDRALQSLSDGLILLDDVSHVVFLNPRAQDFIGFPAEEMIGRRADELVERLAARAAVPDTVKAQLQGALRDRPVSAIELEFANDLMPQSASASSKIGQMPRFLSARFFPIRDADEAKIGTGILLHDVTRERESDASKSQLLSTVSHELRTPLSSIKGFATTLLRQDVRWDETTQRDFLRIIEEEADRLTEIIDNLLDMSQLEAGALRVEKEPIQLRTLIREVVDEMRMRTEAHWFVMDLPAELPLVLADSRRIRQVFHNLLENAIKYSKGGQITVSCEVESENVVVSVTDQGEGIPAEYLGQVFERFFQIDGASTRRVGGSGLGLSISRGIIHAHGGRIWAESTLGQGSTFRFTLPLAKADAAG